MPLWVDEKYIGLVSSQLQKFKRLRAGVYNFRCPVCGDSKKDKNKTRGYFFENKTGSGMTFYCQNCGPPGMSLGNFVKMLDSELHKQYVVDTYKEKKSGFKVKKEKTVKKIEEPKPVKTLFDGLMPSIASLKPDHPARYYIETERKIPPSFYDDIYFIDDMRKIVQLAPTYKERLTVKEGRIVVPTRDRNGKVVAVSCRSLDKDAKLRYIEIKIDEDATAVYGIDRVDMTKKVYVLEGAFDSMFLQNAVAAKGSSLKKIADVIPKKNAVLVYDAQPRNRELVSQIREVIKLGFAVALLPETGYKDINAMILGGLRPEDIKKMIDDNTVTGLTAELFFTRWRKVDDTVSKKNFSGRHKE